MRGESVHAHFWDSSHLGITLEREEDKGRMRGGRCSPWSEDCEAAHPASPKQLTIASLTDEKISEVDVSGLLLPPPPPPPPPEMPGAPPARIASRSPSFFHIMSTIRYLFLNRMEGGCH